MQKIFLAAATLLISTGLFAQKKVQDVAKFKSEVMNMGVLKQNSPKTVEFTVINVGKEPLIIETANPTCGCTVGDYTKSPIAAGKTGMIQATFNAAALGVFEKQLAVKFAGVDEVKNITIKGEVLSAADYAKRNASKPSAANKKQVKTATVANK